MNPHTQKWIYHNKHNWIAPCFVVSNWFQNKDILWPISFDDFTLFNLEALVGDIAFYYDDSFFNVS